MTDRLALFECPCCSGQATVPLAPRQRAPAERPCPNPACLACIGACQGSARRLEVVAAAA